VLTNQPGETSVETHTITTTSDEPVRIKPYPIPYALRETIKKVFNKLKSAGLTVKPSKCQVGYKEIEFLGHVVTRETLSPRSAKISEILAVEIPRTKRQVKSFLAMAGYYSKFIPRYSDISFVLTEATRKGRPNHVEWDSSHQLAFDTLKKKLAEMPILRIVDLDRVMYLQTDASEVGLGCALLQEYDGYLHPVRYHCRKLKKAEQNYSTIEKECLAIVWAIDKLKVYLYGREFILLTDNKPLVFMRESNMKNARVMRWSLFLQDWTFRIESIRGIDHHVADYLSRS
jgi:hypothetical protein